MLVGWIEVGGLGKLPSTLSISERMHCGAAPAHALTSLINLTHRNAQRFFFCASFCAAYSSSLYSISPKLLVWTICLLFSYLYLLFTLPNVSVVSLWAKLPTKILCAEEWPCVLWVWDSENFGCVCACASVLVVCLSRYTCACLYVYVSPHTH